jgi:hypothetical protein
MRARPAHGERKKKRQAGGREKRGNGLGYDGSGLGSWISDSSPVRCSDGFEFGFGLSGTHKINLYSPLLMLNKGEAC